MTLEQIKAECEKCTGCELCRTRTNLVFGSGNEHAKVMFVGEAPGESEDLQGVPFVGRAGQLFDNYLVAVDIKREDVYIANMLKCRPPKNRDPLPSEQDACIEWLRKQVRAIDPKIIVCLGRISAARLIKPDFKITSEHGVWVDRGRFKMTAVYHPSYLLRDPRKRDEMLVDMKKIKEEIDLIS